MRRDKGIERFVLVRQLQFGRGWPGGEGGYTSGNVPGRVLDRIKGEILRHMPELEDHPNLDELVRSLPRRLARSETFDFDASMDADRVWGRGMFTEQEEARQ
jgi:hypothetical protein